MHDCSLAVLLHHRLGSGPNLNGVQGTWDFKWPRDKTIRVAFQALAEDLPVRDVHGEFAKRRRQVEVLARQWLSPDVPVGFHFVEETLPPPGPHSPFGQSDRYAHRRVAYDVLVSLAPLPIQGVIEHKVPPCRGSHLAWDIDRRQVRLPFPTARLGRFALRAEYGTPTVYLGRPDRGQDIVEYFDSKEFEYTVVHEFGHVLGLVHPYQSPDLELPWRSAEQIIEVLHQTRQVKVDKEFVEAHILRRWPATRAPDGHILFSDWPKLPARDPDQALAELTRSVMSHPLLEAFVRSDREAVNAEPNWICAPDPGDRAMLRDLYRCAPHEA